MIAKKFVNPAWSSVLEGLSELNCSSDGGSAHGANVVLCSGGHRVKLHEVMVRRFTRIFHWLPLLPDQQSEFWDEKGEMVVLLPGCDGESLRVLADFLYTGTAVFVREDVGNDFYSLLAKEIQVTCTTEVKSVPGPAQVPPALDSEIDLKPLHEEHQGQDPQIDKGVNDVVEDDFELFQHEDISGDLEMENNVQVEAETVEEVVGSKEKVPRPWDCTDCPSSFKSKPALKRHYRQCHSAKDKDGERLRPFKCPCCKRTYKNRDDMMFHVKKKHSTDEGALKWIQELKILRQNGKRQCQTCAQYFNSLKDLRLHIRAQQCQPENYLDEEELRPFGCPCCKRTYKNRDDMMFHLKKKHPTEEGALKWIQELKISRQNGKRQCQTCARYFESTKDLRLHIRAEHKAEGAYPCPHCLKSFSLEEFLKKHVSRHHGEKPSSYLCKHCGMEFKDRSQLRSHEMRKHGTGERSIKCPQCEKAFFVPAELRSHINFKHSENPEVHACDKCGKSFKSLAGLKTHLLLHIEEKPFKCDQCDYSCRQKPSLKDHMRLHTGEKPFSCKQCQMRFRQKRQLRDHEMTHTGEKRYGCQVCDFKCIQRTDMTKHLTNKHPGMNIDIKSCMLNNATT